MCNVCINEEHAGVIYGLHTGDYDFRYIGKSVGARKRFSDHKYQAKAGATYPVHQWMRKHGVDNIQMTVIETFTDEDIDQIDEREVFHIAQARTYYGQNLNIAEGGGGMTGFKHSEETKKRWSETRAGVAPVNKGIPMSEDQRQKLKVARNNRAPMSDNQKRELAVIMTGNTRNQRGLHNRWHVKRNVVNPECALCQN